MRAIGPIPQQIAIVERDGLTNLFFQLRWEEVRQAAQAVPAIGALSYRAPADLNAALPTTAVYVTLVAGFYRISYYTRKTVADGVASSLTVTIGWLEGGIPLTRAGAVLNVDNTGQYESEARTVYCDAGAALTIAAAYVSNTPGNMHYSLDASVELVQ